MRIRRRTSKCLNCGSSISEIYNYCPVCGQENTTTNLSFGILFKEFFANYFSLDSRFGRSVVPFLFKPGFLTNAFNEGKRVGYAHPVRLYLVISLFHFFLFSWVISDNEIEGEADYLEVSDKDREDLNEILSMPPDDRPVSADDWPLEDWQYTLMGVLKEDGFTDSEILDSLQVYERNWFDQLVIERSLALSDANAKDLTSLIVENIPVMMFFILPLYALLLKLFFYRKGLYIHHLIHSLHIHSFLFFLLGWAWLYEMLSGLDADNILNIIFLLVCIYIVFSFRKVYQQKWRNLILKFFGIGFLYFATLLFALVVEVLISLVVY